jgi:hypothetical protein
MRWIGMISMMVVIVGFVAFASPAQTADRRPRSPTPTPSRSTHTSPRTPPQLTAPTLISPANGTTLPTGELTFAWTAVPGAARYHIQAGLNTYFDEQSNIIEYWSLTSPSYSFTITPGFVVYFPRLYWRVQAIDANNVQGPWSEVWKVSFTQPQRPAVGLAWVFSQGLISNRIYRRAPWRLAS